VNTKVKVLDCTLRDGGYYVDWDFDKDLVRKYFSAIASAKVDMIEIGFRFLSSNKFLGAFAYSSDDYLSSIDLPANIPIAVMVNSSELINNNQGIDNAVDQLFKVKTETAIDVVRIATHVKDIESCYRIAQKLHNLGYRVFLNLMQIDAINLDELVEISSLVSSWEIIEVFYFSDSFGSLDSGMVEQITKSIAAGWFGPIGIHAHDNKGLALSNSIAAQDVGVQYIDSTLYGMGRGAGNTRTEFLLVELMQRGLGKYFPDAIFPMIIQEFRELHERYHWGANIYYYLSATHGIHPTYIQEMLGDERYDTDQILSAIKFLKSSNESFFSFENMSRAVTGIEGDECGKWSVGEWLHGRDVLIIGSGPSTKKYIEVIQLFVEKYKPVVLCLNVNEAVPSYMVDAYVACHETRILIESDSYRGLGKPIILPLTRVENSICKDLHNLEILDYGLRINRDCFEIFKNGCMLNAPLAVAYAMSIVTAGGANKILMAGVDGYNSSDLRQLEMVNMLEKYEKKDNSIPILAITPTSYPIEQRSIFEPKI